MPPNIQIRKRTFTPDLPMVAAVTYVIALLAWLTIVAHWLPMPGGELDVAMRMSDPGAPEAMALSSGLAGAGLYLTMWGVMMVAMMYPSTVPLFRLYYRTLDGTSRTEKATRVGAFMGTYALVWTLTGIVPLAVNAVVPIATVANDDAGFLLGGALLLLAGYQVSPYKQRCLRHCRSPLGFLMRNHRSGVRGAARTSFRFSVFCVGCCWALFAFMVIVGSMNVLWMALITVVLSLERVAAWGARLATIVGVLAATGGVGILAQSML